MTIARALRGFGWLQAVGGLWGLLSSAFEAADRVHSKSTVVHVLQLCEFVFFSTAVFAGYRLARDLPWGRALTLAVQALTAIQFAVPGFSLAAYVGGELCVGQGLAEGDLTAFAGLGGQFIVNIPGPARAPLVTFNLLAVAVVGMILWVRKQR